VTNGNCQIVEQLHYPTEWRTEIIRPFKEEVSGMLVVLGLASLFVVISIVWPIVAIAKENLERTEYTFTACIAGWYAQIMAMVGIIVFTAGIGYLFKGIISLLNLYYSYGYMSYPILGAQGQTNVAYLEQQRLGDLVVRAPSLLVAGPVIYFVFAYLSRSVSYQFASSDRIGR
jgi:hypothetical protein